MTRRGISIPFRAEDGALPVASTGNRLIAESLRLLLTTQPGERVMRPGYGVNLRQFLFQNLTPQLIETMRYVVETAIRQYEPRVELQTIRVSEEEVVGSDPATAITLRIVYTVLETGQTSSVELSMTP